MKRVKVLFYVDEFIEERKFDYEERCDIITDDSLICIKPDGNLGLVINKQHFISIEKMEASDNKDLTATIKIDADAIAQSVIKK